jgi:hypothetical protein
MRIAAENGYLLGVFCMMLTPVFAREDCEGFKTVTPEGLRVVGEPGLLVLKGGMGGPAGWL